MEYRFSDIFTNELLVSAMCSWLIAQLLKLLISSIQNRSFDITWLVKDGGMPSGHSATVSALATASALCFGLGSFQFAITAIFAIVVMHDAMGIRLESGKQARAINEVMDYLKTGSFITNMKKLKEVLGHTPLQVILGSALGITIAIVMHFCIMG